MLGIEKRRYVKVNRHDGVFNNNGCVNVFVAKKFLLQVVTIDSYTYVAYLREY